MVPPAMIAAPGETARLRLRPPTMLVREVIGRKRRLLHLVRLYRTRRHTGRNHRANHRHGLVHSIASFPSWPISVGLDDIEDFRQSLAPRQPPTQTNTNDRPGRLSRRLVQHHRLPTCRRHLHHHRLYQNEKVETRPTICRRHRRRHCRQNRL